MFPGGDAALKHRQDFGKPPIDESVGVQPQAGEDFTAMDAVAIGDQSDVLPIPQHKPVKFAIIGSMHQIFADAIAAIGVKFVPQIITYTTGGNFDDQLGCASM